MANKPNKVDEAEAGEANEAKADEANKAEAHEVDEAIVANKLRPV